MGLKEVAKFLKLKQLNALFNYSTTINLNTKKFKVPIIKNMGLLNLSVKEDWFLELLKKLKVPEGTSFVDVGVNVGQTLLLFRSHYSNTYWGFEPNPACVYYLNALIESNRFRNTHILPVGLSSEKTLAKFYRKNDSDSAGTIVSDLRPDYYEAGETNYVPLFIFDELGIDNMGSISLIKIDVEGAELEVLAGMSETLKKHQPVVICEILDCHSEKSVASMQARADSLVELMRSLNYSVYRILHKDSKIAFEKTAEIKLKVWTPQSWDLNDYLLVPPGKEPN
jgi:FkbM family methyltransferase